MEWEAHDRWASMFGISGEVSREVNEIIDAVRQGEKVSSEYERHLEDCSSLVITDRPRRGNSALDLVVTDYAKRRHDVSRGSKTRDKLAAKVHKCAMRRMGDEYLKAWYLHHTLDYFSENASPDNEFGQMFEAYRENHPEPYSREVEDFLISMRDELDRDLGL